MHTMTPDAKRARRATGALFFSVFGGLWIAGWAVKSGASIPTDVVIALCALALTWWAHATYKLNAPALAATPVTAQGQRAKRVFNIVNAAQWIVIGVLSIALVNLGLVMWIVPMVIAVIGLHFLPLAHVFANPPHYVTGAALLVFGVTYPEIAPLGPLDPVGLLGAGLILWASAVWAIKPRAAATIRGSVRK